MRKGFSLLTAIVMIVLMSAVAAMVFNLAGKTVQETTMQYRKEQAILLAKSYTEFAILAIQGHDIANNGCLNTISGLVNTTVLGGANPNGADRGEGYRVTVSISYIGPALPAPPAPANTPICAGGVYTISASNQLSAIIDVNVRYRNMSAIDAGLTENNIPRVNYNRRTLQRL